MTDFPAKKIAQLVNGEASTGDLFEQCADLVWHFRGRENTEIELKNSFSISENALSKWLKTIAGFANNNGGVLLFGITDSSSNYVVCGIDANGDWKKDHSKLSGIVKSILQPTPDYQIESFKVNDLLVGAIFVKPSNHKPVVAIRRYGESIAADCIYFRYDAETTPIKHGELFSILRSREQGLLGEVLSKLTRIVEIGPMNAELLNLVEGNLEIGSRKILIDENSMANLKFIKEGSFDETAGTPTLKIIGEAQVIPSSSVVRQTIKTKAAISDLDIIEVFLSENCPENPIEFIKQAVREVGLYLPIFFFKSCAKMNNIQLQQLLNAAPRPKSQAKNRLISLARSEHNTQTKTSDKLRPVVNSILKLDKPTLSSLDEKICYCKALQCLDDFDTKAARAALPVLKKIYESIVTPDSNNKLFPHFKRAITRLDVILYR